MVLGIVSLLALVGGVALVILLGVAAFMFLRAILPPYNRSERDEAPLRDRSERDEE